MKIQEKTKNGGKINIDTSPLINVKTEHKANIKIDYLSPLGGSKTVDNSIKRAYYDYREDLDRLAKEWIELVLKQVMERPN